MFTILTVDDHLIVRVGIKNILEDNFPKTQFLEAFDEKSACKHIKDTHIDVLILDLNMPQSNAVEVIEFAKQTQPAIRIIVFTMEEGQVLIRRLIKIGINGFLQKTATDEEIIKAVTFALNNRFYINENLNYLLLKQFSDNESGNPFDKLTNREYQIVKELLSEKSMAEISMTLNISVSTIASHKANIFDKLKLPKGNLLSLQNLAKKYQAI